MDVVAQVGSGADNIAEWDFNYPLSAGDPDPAAFKINGEAPAVVVVAPDRTTAQMSYFFQPTDGDTFALDLAHVVNGEFVGAPHPNPQTGLLTEF